VKWTRSLRALPIRGIVNLSAEARVLGNPLLTLTFRALRALICSETTGVYSGCWTLACRRLTGTEQPGQGAS